MRTFSKTKEKRTETIPSIVPHESLHCSGKSAKSPSGFASDSVWARMRGARTVRFRRGSQSRVSNFLGRRRKEGRTGRYEKSAKEHSVLVSVRSDVPLREEEDKVKGRKEKGLIGTNRDFFSAIKGARESCPASARTRVEHE